MQNTRKDAIFLPKLVIKNHINILGNCEEVKGTDPKTRSGGDNDGINDDV